MFVDALQSKTPRRAEGWRGFWAKETPDVLRNWTHMLCVEGGESVCVCVAWVVSVVCGFVVSVGKSGAD